jgi:hypothetical protein
LATFAAIAVSMDIRLSFITRHPFNAARASLQADRTYKHAAWRAVLSIFIAHLSLL